MSFQLQSPLFSTGSTQKLHRIAFSGDVRDLVNNYPGGDLDLADFGTQLATYNSHVSDLSNVQAASNQNTSDIAALNTLVGSTGITDTVTALVADHATKVASNLSAVNVLNNIVGPSDGSIGGTLVARMNSAESTSASLNTRLTTAESTLTSHTSSIAAAAAAADVTALDTRVQTLENDTRVTTLEQTALTAISCSVNATVGSSGVTLATSQPAQKYHSLWLEGTSGIQAGQLIARPDNGDPDVVLFDFSDTTPGALEGLANIGRSLSGVHSIVLVASTSTGNTSMAFRIITLL